VINEEIKIVDRGSASMKMAPNTEVGWANGVASGTSAGELSAFFSCTVSPLFSGAVD
jgi:hypothetical protein